MVGGRDTPPSIQDGPFGYEPSAVSNFDAPGINRSNKLDDHTAFEIGREIFDSSTNWLNAGRRARWNDSLRAFQNLHPSGSKYLSGDYRYRSTLYRPKTRAMTRRDEAATAAAFFSNEDVVSISARDDDNPQQQASAAILQQLLQYRLTNTIPWFLTIIGARQDAGIMGICVAKAGWEYEERKLRSETRPKLDSAGQPIWDDKAKNIATEDVDLYQIIKDHPYANLIAPENFRFEPGCDWRDPVKSSPYLIELVPVYVSEALERMEAHDGQPAEWERVSESALHTATGTADDVTRRTREAGRVPGKDHDAWKPRHFDICWTRINIVRWRGEDWYFRTLGGGGTILEKPRPLKEVHLHGDRPYVVGSVLLETHKTYPSSKIELTNDLQRAANQDWNSRFDNIMLSLQPRQFVKQGAGQDINDLRTFVPGKVVSINSGKEPITNVVTWDRPPPVDAAAFQEQDRINLDWDDLAGSFTNSSVRSSEVSQQSATGMHLMSGEASGLNEYELRIFGETFVEPLIKLLIKIEQTYETDPEVLATAGSNAKLFQKFGINEITDELLEAGVTVRVNVGIGATNPQLKLRNFATGAQILGSIFGQSAAMGANFQEVSKEVFGMLGYKDGARFFQPGFDPRVHMLQQELQKAQGKGGQGQGESPAATQAKIQVANINAQSKAQSDQMRAQTDARNAELDFHTQRMEEDAETQREMIRLQAEQAKQQADHMHEHQMGAVDRQHDMQMGHMQHQQDLQAQQIGQQHEQQMGVMGQQHEAQMHQSDQAHEGRKTEGQWQHESNMAGAKPVQMGGGGGAAKPGGASYKMPKMPPPPTMQPLTPGQPGQQPMMPPQSQITAPSAPIQQQPEESEVDRQFMQTMMQQMQQMQEGEQVMVQAIGSIAQMIAQATERAEQTNAMVAEAMAHVANSVMGAAEHGAASHQALVSAITRPKKIKRGADGRVEGLE